jgi:hypothetical protein
MKAAEVCCLAANGETAALSPLIPHLSESGDPMKVMQWILAALVIPIVVFIAAYLKINAGGNTKQIKEPDTQPTPEITLFFPRTTSLVDEKDPTGAEWETGVPGHYDFWFQNPNDVPITVGLSYKKCTCSKVEIALESDEWKTWEAKLSLYLMLKTQGSLDLLGPALTGGYDWALPEPERDWKMLVEKDSGFEVHAGATGWVRIDWSSKKIGPDQLPVELWSHSKDSGAPLTRLAVLLVFVPPAGVEPRMLDVGVISAERDPTQKWVACMSPTRESFTIAVAKESDPFVDCGTPLRLSEKDCRVATAAQHLRVKSGYRVPVTVHERLADGRQLDLGPFQLKVFFKTDVAEEPLEFTIKGVVEGEVTVLSPEGRIQMGIFDAAFGEVKETVLESRNLDLNLEFDKAPSFLKVELSKEPKITGGVKTWGLRVEVPKRAVAGEFPRDDNSEYRDCAIYLKIHDPRTPSDQSRRIRIPVSGKASTR